MNQKLTEHLNSVGLTRKKIIEVIGSGIGAIVVYSSRIEDLGTKESDFDVYVISNSFADICDSESNGNCYKRMIDFDPQFYGVSDVAYLYLDVEYWTYEAIENIIYKIEANKFVNEDEIKLLCRIKKGECICGRIESEICQKIDLQKISEYMVKRFAVLSDARLHDCISLFKHKVYCGAILCGRQALGFAIAGLNAIHGYINCNVEKWSSSILYNEKGYGKYSNVYKKYMFGNLFDGDIELNIESMIVFIQDILNKELSFLGKKHWLHKENYKMLDESGDVLYRI